MKKNWIVPCMAIAMIGAASIVALCQGIDGVVLGGSMALIGGIAGFTAGKKT